MFRNLIKIFLGLLIALPIVAGIVGIKLSQFQTMGDAFAQMVMPPETVNATMVREELWQPRVASVGTVVAVQGIVVKSETEGVVRKINFEAGSMVNSGDELVQLDVAIESTQLREAEAAAEEARRVYNRANELYASKTVSEADFSSAETSLRQAEARVANLQAIIARKTVRAPFSGKLGIRRVSVGQFLERGGPVVSLQTLAPVFVEFSLPQQRLGELAEGLRVSVATDTFPGQLFEGEITAVEPEIDVATRSVRVQATLSNADGKLKPGMFVSVDMILDRTETLLFIPATAVQYAPFGNYVYVIEADETGSDDAGKLVVQRRLVELGVTQGDYVAVAKGLQLGEQIVSTGVFKLQAGMSVVIDNTLAPEFSFSPEPDNT